MTEPRDAIEAFVHRLVGEVEAAEAAGMTAPAAIAAHFNATGITTRKGRAWTAATVARFLSSPGAKRHRLGRAESGPTIAYYDRAAESFRAGTWDHDVSQNIAALLDAIDGDPPFVILDFGCGPGRDLVRFRSLGHAPVGLDGSKEFVAMARAASGCEVLHQDFLALDLPPARFDGVFANASLFHVPSAALPRVLRDIRASLKPGGVLFASNPRGTNEEGFNGDRYGCFHDLEAWRQFVTAASFVELSHYCRPPGLPRDRQPWLATVWRKV